MAVGMDIARGRSQFLFILLRRSWRCIHVDGGLYAYVHTLEMHALHSFISTIENFNH
jgi:hypothetical protein